MGSQRAMLRARNKKVKNPHRVDSFKEEVVEVYRRFKTDMESVCEKHGAEINYWYSPSSIPQPKFIIDGVGFDADQLIDEKEPALMAKPRKRSARKVGHRRKSVHKHKPARNR